MNLQRLWRAEGRDIYDVLTSIKDVIENLDTFGFSAAKRVASQLDTCQKQIDADQHARFEKYVHGFPAQEAGRLTQFIRPIVDAVFSESDERFVVTLNRSLVSDRLRDLNQNLSLNDDQQRLQEEVVRCLECEAYRSALVMAWNLVYDYIRSWIYNDLDRRKRFNDVLTAKNDRKGKKGPTKQ